MCNISIQRKLSAHNVIAQLLSYFMCRKNYLFKISSVDNIFFSNDQKADIFLKQ